MLKFLKLTTHAHWFDFKIVIFELLSSLSGLGRKSLSMLSVLAFIAWLITGRAASAINPDSVNHVNAVSNTASELVKVDVSNYVSAKTALQFDKYLALAGGKLNTFNHDALWLILMQRVVSV